MFSFMNNYTPNPKTNYYNVKKNNEKSYNNNYINCNNIQLVKSFNFSM